MEVTVRLSLGYANSHTIMLKQVSSQLLGDKQTNFTDLTSEDPCNKLVDDGDLRDGGIPQVLGINIGVWLVRFTSGKLAGGLSLS